MCSSDCFNGRVSLFTAETGECHFQEEESTPAIQPVSNVVK